MPSGEEEEIAERGRLLVFFIAPAARAFLAFFTNLQSHSESTYRHDDHGRLLQHLARFGRGFARTQKQRHKQALIDSPRYKATFPAHAVALPLREFPRGTKLHHFRLSGLRSLPRLEPLPATCKISRQQRQLPTAGAVFRTRWGNGYGRGSRWGCSDSISSWRAVAVLRQSLESLSCSAFLAASGLT
jgi:hypothetical protein